MIQIHPRFESEAEAYRASSDDMSAVYDGPLPRTYRAAQDRETAIQIARLTHYACAREYLGGLGLEGEEQDEQITHDEPEPKK
jgi:hypothetical protein